MARRGGLILGSSKRRVTRAWGFAAVIMTTVARALVVGPSRTPMMISKVANPKATPTTPIIKTRQQKQRGFMTMMASTTSRRSPVDQVAAAGVVSAASVAAAAVNRAVAQSELSAPDAQKSYVATRQTTDPKFRKTPTVDAKTGLPLSYDKELIETYWRKQGSALQQRWGEFLKLSVPFLLKTATLLVQGGGDALAANDRELAREAREICQKLGPTFIKLAQTLSVRPDVLPPAALEELAILQDAVTPFATDVAKMQIMTELNISDINEVFSHITDEPVAAASLAQVYKATLRETNETVAVKVQRPDVLGQASKDLYVLRRAVEVYQRLIDRFAPQQKTNYVGLLNEWAVGFYSEFDFIAEVNNQNEIRRFLLDTHAVQGVYVPKTYDDFCTSRVAVTEWIDGVKLSMCSPAEIRDLTPVAKEAFLLQLLKEGVFHADPHPGNLLKMRDNDPRGQLALLDFGLVARIDPEDREHMISAVIHLTNKDFSKLVDDFVDLKILPKDTNRATVVPLMDKALSPYVAGGGARKFQARVLEQYGIDTTDSGGLSLPSQGTVGGFQAMTQDALTVLNEVPFSIPPYFALLGRAIVTLEGIALSGDEDYALIQESYPFVSRALLKADTEGVRAALRDALYGSSSSPLSDDVASSLSSSSGKLRRSTHRTKLDPRRLVALVKAAADDVSGGQNNQGGSFIDVDAIADGVEGDEALFLVLDYVLSKDGESLRALLEDEAKLAFDVLARTAARRAFDRGVMQLRPNLRSLVPFVGRALDDALPDLADQRLPIVVPPGFSSTRRTSGSVVFASPRDVVDRAAPPLSRDDELYALDLLKLLQTTDGADSPLSRLAERALLDGDPFKLDPRDVATLALDLGSVVARDNGNLNSFPGDPRSTIAAMLPTTMSGGQNAALLSQFFGGGGFGNDVRENAAGSAPKPAHASTLVRAFDRLADDKKAALRESATRIAQSLADDLADRLDPLLSTGTSSGDNNSPRSGGGPPRRASSSSSSSSSSR